MADRVKSVTAANIKFLELEVDDEKHSEVESSSNEGYTAHFVPAAAKSRLLPQLLAVWHAADISGAESMVLADQLLAVNAVVLALAWALGLVSTRGGVRTHSVMVALGVVVGERGAGQDFDCACKLMWLHHGLEMGSWRGRLVLCDVRITVFYLYCVLLDKQVVSSGVSIDCGSVLLGQRFLASDCHVSFLER